MLGDIFPFKAVPYHLKSMSLETKSDFPTIVNFNFKICYFILPAIISLNNHLHYCDHWGNSIWKNKRIRQESITIKSEA